MNVIYIYASPFRQKDYDEFSCGIMADNFQDMFVWDITPIQGIDRDYLSHDYIEEAPYLVRVKKMKHLKKLLDTYSKIPSVFLLTFSHHGGMGCKYVWEYLNENKCFYGLLYLNSVVFADGPADMTIPDPSVYISQKKRKSTLHKLFHKLIHGISWRISLLRDIVKGNFYNFIKSNVSWLAKVWFPYDIVPLSRLSGYLPKASFIAVSGKRGVYADQVLLYSGEKTDIVHTHITNYELYLKWKRDTASKVSTSIFPKQYIVFLDQYMGFYPSFPSEIKEKFAVDGYLYYKKLSSFIEKVERLMEKKCLIAAHPHADYKGKEHFFEGREIFYGKTIELVEACSLVLSQASMATSYAILFQKPIIGFLFVENEMTGRADFSIKYLRSMGKEPIWAEGDYKINIEQELEINNIAYKNFYENFIKTNASPDRFMGEIITDYIHEKVANCLL